MLYLAAASGDGAARQILTACGEDYALSIRCVAERLGLRKPVEVALIGSHFTKCEDNTTIDTIRRLLDPHGKGEYRLHIMSTEPVAGALLWALERAGIRPGPDERSELMGRVKGLRG